MEGLVIVAGARKAGTSWLYEAAASDERFSVPTVRKELNFFDDHYHRGLDWYAAQFDPPAPRLLDCSPAYFAKPEVPERIAESTPHARVVFVLREPIARLVSDFHHARRRGDVAPDATIGAAVRHKPSLVEESRYAAQLDRWLAQPGLGPVGVVFFDDLARDPQAFYDAFCAAAGVDPRGLAPAQLAPVFERAQARSAAVMRVVIAGTRFLHRRNLSWVTRPFARSARVRGLLEREDAFDEANGDASLVADVGTVAEALAADTHRLRTMLTDEARFVCFGEVPGWASD